MKRKRTSLIAALAAAGIAAASLTALSANAFADPGRGGGHGHGHGHGHGNGHAEQTCVADAPGTLGGDLGAHDPGLFAPCEEGEPWYVFATGYGPLGEGNVTIRTSTDDGATWSYVDTVWDVKPDWLTEAVPGVDNLWAPEIFHDADEGRYYLYYSASTFGNQRSVIGLATNTTLDPSEDGYEWVDEGQVWESNAGDPYNAIDPTVLEAAGRHYMAYGSWWQGIYMLELDWPSGEVKSGASPVHVAGRGGAGIEAPSLVEHGGYYYLFTSWDACCAGADSTYNIRVGRSTSPTGPFTDADGVALTDGGGTLVLGAHGDYVATGGQSIANGLMAYHSYHEDGHFDLGIEAVEWQSGWPVLDGS
ncbi:arabinan endo-1,5-alpha-L-arabinosidase [Glycomyces harbinensis]|uniref:Arabinan endo-1,5-alpha-L-arabinosidase n=1 Tax=Glycomyces harbinensis TaxID=58114 RepID=A0A1G6Y427_9ACTN|nr:arabinan endo-1,5-alpha-L-arabinosidase [Glycomyces harbinensis]SDD85244.1 arabinan endo-1,5-alpha-L-arabinosidase [Glycomyces harbinensis]